MKRSCKHIFLAVPTRGSIRWETVTRLEQARDEASNLRPILYEPGNLSVALTRNKIVNKFMQTDCSTLVMVDDDIVPPPDFLDTLDPYIPEYGVVSIPHPMPHPVDKSKIILTGYLWDRDGLQPAIFDNGIHPVDAVATGCVAISREALETLGANPFKVSNDPFAYVQSDDFIFCNDLIEAGFKVGCYYTDWYCDHVTTVSIAPILEGQLVRR